MLSHPVSLLFSIPVKFGRLGKLGPLPFQVVHTVLTKPTEQPVQGHDWESYRLFRDLRPPR